MGRAEMGLNAGGLARRWPAHGACPGSARPLRSWGRGLTLLPTARTDPLLAQAWGQDLLAPAMPPGLRVRSKEPSEKRAFIKQAECLFGESNGFQMFAGPGAWEPAMRRGSSLCH